MSTSTRITNLLKISSAHCADGEYATSMVISDACEAIMDLISASVSAKFELEKALRNCSKSRGDRKNAYRNSISDIDSALKAMGVSQ